MQLAYVEGFVSVTKEMFERFVRRNSGSALMHVHAG